MSDIFISYAHSTEATAARIADVLRAQGHAVWRDDQLLAHGAFADVIEERLRAAKAVIVVWSADAAKSQWVRAEADLARSAGTLVQLCIDGCSLPLPFNQIQCVDLHGWNGETDAPGWRKVVASVTALLNGTPPPVDARAASAKPKLREIVLAVLAFDNLSSDADLSYFSDGVSEEILYTVARTRDIRVIGKASSFQFRGREKAPQRIVEALGASHLLDGSVRRSGNNIRIHVELVDTATLHTLWSERYDRALTDIFALQDEIAGAIAEALDRHFAPARTPISIDPAAYDLYLQARAIYAQDLTWADQAKCVTLLEGAVSRAPDFAQAWGRLGVYRRGEAAVVAARRGLALDPDCAISLAALSLTMPPFARHAEKLALAERAYALAPDDQLVAGVYALALVSTGLLTESCAVADARAERDPLSPLVAGGRAVTYRAAKRPEAAAVAERAASDFPGSDYVKFIQGILAIYDSDIDRAEEIVATLSMNGDAIALQMLTMFIRTIGSMDAGTRAVAVGQFLTRAAPTSSIVDIGLAAAVGEVELAFEHLLGAVREGRPLEFTHDNDGRGPTGATTTAGMFMPNFEALRPDKRFAEVCVRLGLYDCWQATGHWPDCVAEVAPFYDLKAECAGLAATLPRYRAQSEAM